MIINLSKKALSVNQCWQGRRFKTKKYKEYEKDLLLLLPSAKLEPYNRMSLCVTFGYSNKLNDIDNGLKPLIDILQKKYGFNDRDIYELNVKKKIVKKGEEFITIKINKYESKN